MSNGWADRKRCPCLRRVPGAQVVFDSSTVAFNSLKNSKGVVMKRPLIMFALLVMLTGGTCAKKQGKIFYINSYHRGYGSSDGIMAGIESTLIGKNVIMETFYMDTKRYPEEDSIRIKTTQALNGIKRFRPD